MLLKRLFTLLRSCDRDIKGSIVRGEGFLISISRPPVMFSLTVANAIFDFFSQVPSSLSAINANDQLLNNNDADQLDLVDRNHLLINTRNGSEDELVEKGAQMPPVGAVDHSNQQLFTITEESSFTEGGSIVEEGIFFKRFPVHLIHVLNFDSVVQTTEYAAVHTKPHTHRYCGNRFSKWEYQIFILLCILNVIVAILIPLSYFIFIPSIIQSTLNDLGTNSASRVVLRSFSMGNFSTSSLKVGVDLGIPSPVPFLPVKAGLGDTGIRVTDGAGRLIALTNCPPLNFWVNEEIGVDVLVDVNFSEEAQENLRILLGKLFFTLMTRFTTD